MRDVDGGKATISLGETAEEVAVLDGISRAESDAWGLRSQQRTAAAAERLEADLVRAAQGRRTDRGRGPASEHDDRGAREAQPAFERDGIVTAGTASPLSDGAGAIVVASGRRSSATA